ncbi:hypothetical protein A3K73_01965 [Candidatus Pacearchaeota archaeon RBG_13_36_9]|nr:MAG: hypothetical protein A3K73_01965 [Candidatus Pacearchaeota archaeon RBG_13_36_9]
MSLTESVTEETERIDALNSLIGQFKPGEGLDGEYVGDEDSGIFHSLALLRIALEENLLKEESCKAIFSGEKPFYSEQFRFCKLPVGGRAYYLIRNGECYRIKIRNFFKAQEPFDIYRDCEGMDKLD